MQEIVEIATESMEQRLDVSYLKDELEQLASKIGSFDSKNGTAALECIQQNMPTDLTSQRRQQCSKTLFLSTYHSYSHSAG